MQQPLVEIYTICYYYYIYYMLFCILWLSFDLVYNI
jgi:hypothetical protein